MKTKIIILLFGIVCIIFAAIVFVVFQTYWTTPGFTSEEGAREFFATRPTCYGISIPLGSPGIDAGDQAVCVGYLKKAQN